MTTYRKVRALERGLDVLVALNELKSARASDIGHHAGIHRTTAHRLLETLRAAGYVYYSSADDTYRLACRARSLSDRIDLEDHLVERATELLPSLTGRIRWPSDLTFPRPTGMLVRESSHRVSPWSEYTDQIGSLWPYGESAVGRAYMSACEPEKRNAIVEMLCSPDGMRDRAHIHLMISKTVRDGYSQSCLEAAPKIAAIAVPVRDPWGYAIGAVNVIFFASAMTTTEAAKRHLADLRGVATDLENVLGKALERSARLEGRLHLTAEAGVNTRAA